MTNNKFSLEGKSLKLDSASDIAPFIEQLVKIDGLEAIDLSGNTFGVDACTALAQALKSKKSLKEANFADMFTGRLKDEIPACLSVLFPALLELPDLHTINLSDNAFGLSAVDPLADFLSKHTPLQHLLLANNGFGPIAGSKVALALKSLAKAKEEAKSKYVLETVICGRNRLENGSMEAWSACFAENKDIKEVRLYQNGIRQEGIRHLLTIGLFNSKKLQKLDLQDNTFTVTGALALAKALPNWTEELVELGIGDCLLSTRGGEILGKALMDAGRFPNLKILRLQYNEIDINGVQLIKEALTVTLEGLERLELNGNKFSEDDPVVAEILDIFDGRGIGELDNLSDMEEESEDEEEDEEEEEEEEEEEGKNEEEQEEELPKVEKEVQRLAEAILKDAEEEEDLEVAAEKESEEKDELAVKIGNLSV
ncbi:hypothetical protein V1517DRAFT_271828 [Lipomyces orientalis]|uniref:Uncharacterized protein n=1 Tax=Lipomyces orientalis TaxID=1233043 RepID=A0ACC3TU02_9ASCO